MTFSVINIGETANDGTGTALRDAITLLQLKTLFLVRLLSSI